MEFKGHVNVCCHRIEFRYDIGRLRPNAKTLERLEDEARNRARELIIDGCGQGELNCLAGGKEIRGWWRIESISA